MEFQLTGKFRPIWYTPQIYIEAARDVMGSIDLDPCTDEAVQARIKAGTYYTKETDGLSQDWFGNIWLASPYHPDLCRQFHEKALKTYYTVENATIISLIHTMATHEAWFYGMVEASSAMCFVKGRVQWEPGHKEQMKDLSELGIIWDPHYNVHGSVIFYLGKYPDRFNKAFMQFGVCKF